MVELGEEVDFLEHLLVVWIVAVDNCLFDGIDVAIQDVLHSVHLPKAPFTNQLQLFKLALVSSARDVLILLDGFLWNIHE